MFESDLCAMLKMLQCAAATAGKMFAQGIDATWGGRDNIYYMGFVIIALLIVATKFNCFSGQRTIDKAGLTVGATDAAAVVNQINNFADQGSFVGHSGILCGQI